MIDLKELGDLVKREIHSRFDHKNLNLDVDFMKGKMASTENLAIEIWKILAPAIKTIASEAALHSIRLYETPRNYVEYFGE